MQTENITPPPSVKPSLRTNAVPLNSNPILAAHGLNGNFEKRFWKHVSKTESCWLWTGHTSGGYGNITRGARGTGPIRAHRASWLLHRGEIPDGLWVLHNCPGGDNRACVCPDHLWLGTVTDNNRDMVRKGTYVPPCIAGESHVLSKLKWINVLEIRQLWSTGGWTITSIAEKFGVGWSTIKRVIVGESWKREK